MQPGSRNLTGELNTVEDLVGDERCMALTMWYHKQECSVLAASPVVIAIADAFDGIDVTNLTSHACSVRGVTV